MGCSTSAFFTSAPNPSASLARGTAPRRAAPRPLQESQRHSTRAFREGVPNFCPCAKSRKGADFGYRGVRRNDSSLGAAGPARSIRRGELALVRKGSLVPTSRKQPQGRCLRWPTRTAECRVVYLTADDRPQPRLDVDRDGGMTVTVRRRALLEGLLRARGDGHGDRADPGALPSFAGRPRS